MNMTGIGRYVAGGIVALGLAVGTQAQDAEPFLDFDRMNTDGNDCVDWEEMRNGAMLFWDTLDLNRDALLSGDEHPEAVNDEGETVRPPTIDTGRYQAAIYVAFRVADTDESGCLSREEYEAD